MPRPKPDWGRQGTQPQGSAGPQPRPNGRTVATKPTVGDVLGISVWVTVRCSECGKVLCEAQRGSVVRVVCRKCKTEQVTQVA